MQFFCEIKDRLDAIQTAFNGTDHATALKRDLDVLQNQLRKMDEKTASEEIRHAYKTFVVIMAIPELDGVIRSPLTSNKLRTDANSLPSVSEFLVVVELVKKCLSS